MYVPKTRVWTGFDSFEQGELSGFQLFCAQFMHQDQAIMCWQGAVIDECRDVKLLDKSILD
jgi:hypothetical protein